MTSLLSAFMSPSELLHAVMANCNQLMQLINQNGTAAISGNEILDIDCVIMLLPIISLLLSGLNSYAKKFLYTQLHMT